MILNEEQSKVIALEMLSSGAYLVINKNLLLKYGPNTAIFLSNLIDKYKFFREKDELQDDCFYLKHEDQINEIGLNERKIRKCKTLLKENNIISTKLIGIPPKEYYKIHWENILNFLNLCVRDKGYKSVRDKGSKNGSDLGGKNGRFNIYNNKVINNNKINNNKVAQKQHIRAKHKITTKLFDDFWQIYPKKADKGKALSAWNKICTRKNIEPPTFEEIKTAIEQQIKTDRWKDKMYIPHPTTWLNQQRWLDDPKEMKSFDYKSEPKTGYIGPSVEYKKPKVV